MLQRTILGGLTVESLSRLEKLVQKRKCFCMMEVEANEVIAQLLSSDMRRSSPIRDLTVELVRLLTGGLIEPQTT